MFKQFFCYHDYKATEYYVKKIPFLIYRDAFSETRAVKQCIKCKKVVDVKVSEKEYLTSFTVNARLTQR